MVWWSLNAENFHSVLIFIFTVSPILLSSSSLSFYGCNMRRINDRSMVTALATILSILWRIRFRTKQVANVSRMTVSCWLFYEFQPRSSKPGRNTRLTGKKKHQVFAKKDLKIDKKNNEKTLWSLMNLHCSCLIASILYRAVR